MDHVRPTQCNLDTPSADPPEKLGKNYNYELSK